MKLLRGIVSALSVHQLAAQGEMLYLATRIEQGTSLFLRMYLNKFNRICQICYYFIFIQESIKKEMVA